MFIDGGFEYARFLMFIVLMFWDTFEYWIVFVAGSREISLVAESSVPRMDFLELIVRMQIFFNIWSMPPAVFGLPSQKYVKKFFLKDVLLDFLSKLNRLELRIHNSATAFTNIPLVSLNSSILGLKMGRKPAVPRFSDMIVKKSSIPQRITTKFET